MTSYIDTTATAVSQIKNKPEATGLTSTTSIDMTRNNEHENNHQESKNIKTIEVNLTGLGSMKAKEKKGTLKRDEDYDEDSESDNSELQDSDIDDEYHDPSAPYNDVRLKTMKIFGRKGYDYCLESSVNDETTSYKIISKYWYTFINQLSIVKQQVPKSFNHYEFCDAEDSVMHKYRKQGLDDALDYILKKIHIDPSPDKNLLTASTDENQFRTQTSYQSKFNERDLRQFHRALDQCLIFDGGFQYMCYTRYVHDSDSMLKCYCPGGKMMKKWREDNGLTSLFLPLQEKDEVGRRLGATCSQQHHKGGLHTPFSFLNHCRYEMRVNKCPIHTMLLVYLAKTFGWNHYRFGHVNFAPFAEFNPMRRRSLPDRTNKSNMR